MVVQNETENAENKEMVSSDIVDKERIKSKIYVIRGRKVMIDQDIAEFFDVTTGNLNKAMKRNISRFPDNFCFQLSESEFLRFQFGISKGSGGRRYLPYAYTEQGVAMLTSVLHTERAIRASILIMEAFVEMNHFIQQNAQLIPFHEMKVLENKTYELNERVQNIERNMITRSDLSEFLKLFDEGIEREEILILNGEPFKADAAYQRIYEKAKKRIIVVDDYIGLKTLYHLVHAKQSVCVTVISDNKGTKLRLSEYNDFLTEYPAMNVSFVKSLNMVHDRYIVIDYETDEMQVFLCGSSSKDSGNKITTIVQVRDLSPYTVMVASLMSNPPLILQ